MSKRIKMDLTKSMKNLKLIIILIIIIHGLSLSAQSNIPISNQNLEERELNIRKALELRKEENFSSAIAKLDLILKDKNDDAPILLLKGDLQLQAKNFSDAVKTYKILLPLNYEKTTTQINLSYALFMDNDASTALEYAKSAWENDTVNSSAIVNYFNAMLWNVKTDEASSFINEYGSVLKEDQNLVMNARLFTTSGNYKKGLNKYDTLITKFQNKYYVQEYAEVLLSKKEIAAAKNILKNADSLFTTNEYNSLLQKVNTASLSNIGTEYTHFKDIAKNIRIENNVWWQQNEGSPYRFGVRLGISNTTSAANEKTDSKFINISLIEKWSMAWSGQTDIILQNISFGEQKKFTSITGKQLIQFKPTDRNMYGLFISTDILNYTSSLIGKNIRNNTIGYMTHIMFDGRNGIYSQGGLGIISDGNKKYEFFGSLYHLFSTKPLLKTGINFSALHFNNNSISTYFSPDKYLSTEIFIDYNTSLFGLSDLNLETQIAAGFQNIEAGAWEKAFRLQTQLSYNIEYFQIALKYQTSNVASGTGTGYQFDWFTFKLSYNF